MFRYSSLGANSSLPRRSRSEVSISAFWWALARLVKGNEDRLRARRMRLEMTISHSEPVPRSHSPLFCVRLSRDIRSFLLSNQIAQRGSLFVSFCIDCPPQQLSKFHELRL